MDSAFNLCVVINSQQKVTDEDDEEEEIEFAAALETSLRHEWA